MQAHFWSRSRRNTHFTCTFPDRNKHKHTHTNTHTHTNLHTKGHNSVSPLISQSDYLARQHGYKGYLSADLDALREL